MNIALLVTLILLASGLYWSIWRVYGWLREIGLYAVLTRHGLKRDKRFSPQPGNTLGELALFEDVGWRQFLRPFHKLGSHREWRLLDTCFHTETFELTVRVKRATVVFCTEDFADVPDFRARPAGLFDHAFHAIVPSKFIRNSHWITLPNHACFTVQYCLEGEDVDQIQQLFDTSLARLMPILAPASVEKQGDVLAVYQRGKLFVPLFRLGRLIRLASLIAAGIDKWRAERRPRRSPGYSNASNSGAYRTRPAPAGSCPSINSTTWNASPPP